MVLNVAAELLNRSPDNARKLSGEAISSNLHSAERYRPGTSVGSLTMRAVPGHGAYVLYPYERDYPASAERCHRMGNRCGVTVEVEFGERNTNQEFWKFLKEHVGGVPGQKETWRGASQWSVQVDGSGDHVGIHVGNPELLWVYIRSNESQPSEERAARMRWYSFTIHERLGDQQLGDNLERNSASGMSITVEKPWVRDDEGEWLEAAQWIRDQCDRLHSVVAERLGNNL